MSILLLCMTWCTKPIEQLSPIPEETRTEPQTLKSFFSGDVNTYPSAKVVIKEWKGRIVQEMNWEDTEDKRYKRVNKTWPDGPYKEATITGYVYEYRYEDLWFKITTPAMYEPIFSTLTDNVFYRHQNMVYDTWANVEWGEYIKMFKKDANQTLKEVVEKNHLGKWCEVYSDYKEDNHFMDDPYFKNKFLGIDFTTYIEITGPGGSLWSDIECNPDKEFNKNRNIIVFFESKYHKDRYYKLSFGDACAPGPCSIFGNIEIF